MQPGQKSHQIERARNELDLGVLGDPERWGASGELSFDVPTTQEVWSPQIIRVQCADLISRSWGLLVHWHIDGLDNILDTISRCGFELTIGVGQASARMVLDLTAAVQGNSPEYGYGNIPNVPWELTPATNGGFSDGTVTLPWGIPAVALAGRFVLQVTTSTPPPVPVPVPGPSAKPAIGFPLIVRRITASCFACVSPRSV